MRPLEKRGRTSVLAAIAAPPSQAGHPETSKVTTAQYHGQKPLGLSSEVAAKNDRPVFMLYLMHS